MKRKGNRLKKCPICGAQSFEDIETCFGCMHQFKNDQINESKLEAIPEPILETARIDIALPKENRAKHRAIENDEQATQEIKAEYKLVVSLIPA